MHNSGWPKIFGHEAARAPHAMAAETCRDARRACRQLHGRLEAFLGRWVPAGADAEKLEVLEALKLIEEGLSIADAPPPA